MRILLGGSRGESGKVPEWVAKFEILKARLCLVWTLTPEDPCANTGRFDARASFRGS